MASSPVHLVERAAERLREGGFLDGGANPPQAAPDQPVIPPSPPPTPAAAASAPTAAELEEAALAPGQIIDTPALERAGMINWNQARSRIAEEFRLAQSQILRAAFSADAAPAALRNLVMVTSSRPAEGKSFIAVNLAASIARQHDREVLLVDGDWKHDSIGLALGLRKSLGLLDLCASPGMDVSEVILRTSLPKLSVLPIGRDVERSAELFATRRMATLIESLARRYSDRIVIMDTPPALSSSDPSTLASIVGQVVLVVKAEHTQRAEVEAALDLIQSCPAITLLLNQVQVSSTHSFGAYAYGYGYGPSYS